MRLLEPDLLSFFPDHLFIGHNGVKIFLNEQTYLTEQQWFHKLWFRFPSYRTIRSTWNVFRVWNFKKIGSKYGVQKVGSLLFKKRRGSHAEVLYFWFVLISPILKTQKFHCELWWWFWTSESNPGFTNLKCQTLVPWRCCQNINAPSYIILTHCGMYNLILMSLYGFCFECTAQYLCIIRRVDNSLISTQSSLVLG